MGNPKVKRRKTYDLQLTQFELLHLRDLMSICLPPDDRTVSQALATLEDRSLIESYLWRKLIDICKVAELPIDIEAPDYVIAPTGMAPLGVFQLAQEPAQVEDHVEEQPPVEESDHDVLFGGKKKRKKP
jgi:hypothetical protein